MAVVATIGISAVSFAANDKASIDTARPRLLRDEVRDAKFEAVNSALSKSDYQAWLQAVGADSQQAKIITADKFPQLVQAHQLQQEARTKMEQARQIREDLGLKGPQGQKGPGQKMGGCNKMHPPEIAP